MLYLRGGVWYYRIFHRGREFRGSTFEKSKTRARRVAERIAVEIREHGRPVGERERISLGEFSELYLHEHASSRKSAAMYHVHARRLLAHPGFRSRYLGDFTLRHVSQYQKARLRDGVKPSTVNREVQQLRAMLNLAVRWGYLASNPIAGLDLLRESTGRTRWLSDEELERLAAAAAPHLRPIILLGAHTGLRLQELLGLRWEQVQGDFLDIRETKSGRGRIVPLNSVALEVLRSLPRRIGTPWVFPKEDGSRRRSIRRAFATACRRAGIEDLTPHDLRHSCASGLPRRGVSLYMIQQLLGHADPRTTQRYAHLQPEHLVEAMESLSRAPGKGGNRSETGTNTGTLRG